MGYDHILTLKALFDLFGGIAESLAESHGAEGFSVAFHREGTLLCQFNCLPDREAALCVKRDEVQGRVFYALIGIATEHDLKLYEVSNGDDE